MGTGGSLARGIKPKESEADYLTPYNAEVKNVGAIPPLPHMSSWRGGYLI
jgi:hypothetical protein